jgi:osmotically inducible protein OsmC
MTDRTATTTWKGVLASGSGTTSFDSSGVGTFDVSWPSRAESPDGRTSPEELLAAAHASCFSMALANQIDKAGGTPTELRTTATVTFDVSSVAITKIVLSVRADVEGLDADGFAKAAQAAKDGCPVSKVVAGNAEIVLDAALA